MESLYKMKIIVESSLTQFLAQNNFIVYLKKKYIKQQFARNCNYRNFTFEHFQCSRKNSLVFFCWILGASPHKWAPLRIFQLLSLYLSVCCSHQTMNQPHHLFHIQIERQLFQAKLQRLDFCKSHNGLSLHHHHHHCGLVHIFLYSFD